MDGREAKEIWEQIKNNIMQMGAPVRRLFGKAGTQIFKLFLRLGGNFAQNMVEKIGDKSGYVAFNRVKKDGPNKNTTFLGEFDRIETEEIVKMAEEANVKIAISEKTIDLNNGASFARTMSTGDMQQMNHLKKTIEEQNSLINKYSLKNYSDDKKQRKISEANAIIVSAQKEIKDIQEKYKNKKYTIVVNSSKKEFIQSVKDNILDHDTKETIARLKKEKFNRTQFEDLVHDFKDAERVYTEANSKVETLYHQKEEKQEQFNELMQKKDKGGLTEDEMKALNKEIKTTRNELTDIKEQWTEQIKIRDLAKETYEKKSFVGELSKENIQNSKGNLSMSMDKFDITHFPEGYASIQLSPDEYYDFITQNESQLHNMSYAAFKESEHSDVELLCSTNDIQIMSDMLQNQKDSVSIDVHQNTTNLKLDSTKNISRWEFTIEDSNRLQDDIQIIDELHKERKSQYMMDIERQSDNKSKVVVRTSLPFENLQKFELEIEEKRKKQAIKQRDEHIKAVQANRVHDYTERSVDRRHIDYTKEQQTQLTIGQALYMDENSNLYDPNKQEFLQNNDLSPEAMKAFNDGFMNGLSVEDAQSLYDSDMDVGELADSIGDILSDGKEK